MNRILVAVLVVVLSLSACGPQSVSRIEGSPSPRITARVEYEANRERIAKRKAREKEQIAKESMMETVQSLAEKTYMICYDPLILPSQNPGMSPRLFFAHLRSHPRVSKLLDVCQKGTDDEKAILTRAIRGVCQRYVDELPDSGIQGKPWKPSVMFSGGIMGLVYLLPRVQDDPIVGLRLVVDMANRLRDARARYHGRESPRWGYSDDGMVFAYACEEFLERCYSNQAIMSGLSGEQKDVLEAYRRYREARDPKRMNLFREQIRIVKYSVRFVGAGQTRKADES